MYNLNQELYDQRISKPNLFVNYSEVNMFSVLDRYATDTFQLVPKKY